MSTVKKILIAVIFTSICVAGLPWIVRAQNPLNFGGIHLNSLYCPCSGTVHVTVGPPKPIFVVYAFTPQYAKYLFPFAFKWALGLYSPPGICLIPGPFGCGSPIPIPNGGTVTPIVGTS